MRTRNYDEWTIERWRTEPRLSGLELNFEDTSDGNPPLWKDLALASLVALLLWVAAAAILF